MGRAAETLVLLHGFSGTRRAWDGVIARLDPERYLPLALDLPGHGEAADAPRPITFAGCVAAVLAQAPERFTLCGYSLGGRVALHVALAAPERVERLVLVSSTAGIEDETERAERRVADRRLADELEEIPFEEFIERWRTQPLFAEEPPEVGELAREDQRRNRPDALAAVLRGIGTAEMEPLWGGWTSWRCRSLWSWVTATRSSKRSAGGWWACCRPASWSSSVVGTGLHWRIRAGWPTHCSMGSLGGLLGMTDELLAPRAGPVPDRAPLHDEDVSLSVEPALSVYVGNTLRIQLGA